MQAAPGLQRKLAPKCHARRLHHRRARTHEVQRTMAGLPGCCERRLGQRMHAWCQAGDTAHRSNRAQHGQQICCIRRAQMVRTTSQE